MINISIIFPLRDDTKMLLFILLFYNAYLVRNNLLVMKNVEAFTQEYTKCWGNTDQLKIRRRKDAKHHKRSLILHTGLLLDFL
jgi:hypothetical protein